MIEVPCTDDNNCSVSGNQAGGKGITYWGMSSPQNLYLEANGGRADVYFTGSKPKCYNQGANACLVSWETQIDSTISENEALVKIFLNGIDLNAEPIGGGHHSKIKNHDITETVDITQPLNLNNPYLGDDQQNKLTFINTSSVGISILRLRIARIYGMCSIACQGDNYCTGSPCPGSSSPCLDETATTTNGAFDGTRQDYPCSYATCGGYSFTKFGSATNPDTVSPNETIQWYFVNPSASNYVGSSACFFNLNNIAIATGQDDDLEDDVKISLSVNGSPNVYLYLSKLGDSHVAAGLDLAGRTEFAGYYNDASGATNTVTLTNLSQVDLKLFDGDAGKIDIYRIYRTSPVYLTITAQAGSGGSISPSGTVSVTYNGSQLFYITPNAGYQIDHVVVDGVSQGAPATYSFTNIVVNHTITAYFSPSCGTCYTMCQDTCQITCQPCQTGCQVSCQTGCEVSCQNACETGCQIGCEVGCQTACEIACEGCQTGCEPCYASCETTCESVCQTGCQVSCQEACQTSCQTACEASCQATCQLSCQDYCQINCQTGCLSCYAGCIITLYE